jgi:hypothetical protein
MAEPGKVACCWTCKIRHVKCDGATTSCFQCTSKQVHCHGYGPMPTWMDGDQNEKQERQRIKDAVKKSFKQKKKLQAHQLRGHKQNTRRGRKLAKPAAEGLQLSENPEGKYHPLVLMLLTQVNSKCRFRDHFAANTKSSIFPKSSPPRKLIR